MLRSSARALLLLALLHAPVARAAPRDLFHQHYDRGVAAYKARDYARAITAFQAAYELRQLPRLLFNLAQAERQQGDAAAALVHYERYLRLDPDLGPAERREVEEYIAKLRESTQPLPAPLVVPVAAPPPVAPPPPRVKTPRRPRWRIGAGAAALVVGAGLAGVGAWALAVDGGCASPAPTPGFPCPQLYASTAPGAAFLGGGALIMVGGALLLAWPPRRVSAGP